MTPSLDRIRGCLFGVACADALGAPFEGQPFVGHAELRSWSDSQEPLRHTDDTAMTLVVADALAKNEPLEEEPILAGFVAEWRRDPARGYGPGMRELFSLISSGTSAVWAAERLYAGAGSLGNGAAMRTAPIAFLDLSLHEVAYLARRIARTTHTHPIGAEGAVMQAAAVTLALRGDTTRPLDQAAFVNAIRAAMVPMAYALQLNRLANLPTFATSHQIATWFGNDASALNSVPAAIAAFLTAPDDPEQAIGTAIEIGGDTDTIAAMTGALAGARCGLRALPAHWLARLTVHDRIEDVADRILSATSA